MSGSVVVVAANTGFEKACFTFAFSVCRLFKLPSICLKMTVMRRLSLSYAFFSTISFRFPTFVSYDKKAFSMASKTGTENLSAAIDPEIPPITAPTTLPIPGATADPTANPKAIPPVPTTSNPTLLMPLSLALTWNYSDDISPFCIAL